MPSLSTKEPFPLNLAVGFEWHAVLTICYYPAGSYAFFEAVPSAGKRTIFFKAAPPTGDSKITIGLDEQNNLFLEVMDIEGNRHVTPPFPAVELMHLAHLGCSVGPTDKGTTQLSIRVNDVVRANIEVTANFGDSPL